MPRVEAEEEVLPVEAAVGDLRLAATQSLPLVASEGPHTAPMQRMVAHLATSLSGPTSELAEEGERPQEAEREEELLWCLQPMLRSAPYFL